ncbi:unnamed protein product, partial [Ilex paraguariensis]
MLLIAVPVGVIASSKKVKRLTKDAVLVVAALGEYSLLVVSLDGKNVKRLHPLPFTAVRDPELCIVLIENLPEDHSVENIQHIFDEAGSRGHADPGLPVSCLSPLLEIESKDQAVDVLYARVEYETVEAAEKAVATLNDEQDWRCGMWVKLLERMRTSDSEKTSSVQASDLADEEKRNLNVNHKERHDEE